MKKRSEIKTSIISLLTNLGLTVVKIMGSLISNSTTLLADGINSLSDSLNSLISIFSFYYASRPADEKHPYGHERMETIGGLIVVLIMGYLGIDLLRKSIVLLFNPSSIHFDVSILFILILSIVLKIILTIYLNYQSKKLNSEIIKANAMDAFFDIFMSCLVLIAMLLEHNFGWKLDAYFSLFLSLVIIWSAMKMIRSFVNDLLGHRPDQQLLDVIDQLLSQDKRILGYHDLLVHQYGKNRIYASVDVELDDRLSLNEAHDIIDSIESQLLEKENVRLSIHLDPVNFEDQQLLESEELIGNYLKQHYPNADFHDLRRINNHGLRFDLVLDGGDETLLSKIHLELIELLNSHDIHLELEVILDDHQILPND